MGRRPPNNAQNPPPRAEWWCRAEVRARRAPELPPADKARAFRALTSARHHHSAGGVGSGHCWAATVALKKKLYMSEKSRSNNVGPRGNPTWGHV